MNLQMTCEMKCTVQIFSTSREIACRLESHAQDMAVGEWHLQNSHMNSVFHRSMTSSDKASS